MNKSTFLFSIIILSTCCAVAQQVDKISSCPVTRWIGELSGDELINRFEGDTIYFRIPNVENNNFESFTLLSPDTTWLKNKPINKPAQENKHYRIHKNFESIQGWGVNSHREYTPGTSLEGRYFILRGVITKDIPYLGKFDYILLEDCISNKIINWDYTKQENNGILILSPSISRHLQHMVGKNFVFEIDNSNHCVPATCTDVTFTINLQHKKFTTYLNVKFISDNGDIISTNWNPHFYLKPEGSIIN